MPPVKSLADGIAVKRVGELTYDIVRNYVDQMVTVSDGTTTKTHTVLDLFVDGVDVTADTVFGRANPSTSVDVWLHDLERAWDWKAGRLTEDTVSQ